MKPGAGRWRDRWSRRRYCSARVVSPGLTIPKADGETPRPNSKRRSRRAAAGASAKASVAEIDRINILQATFLAMTRAVEALGFEPAEVLVDGNRLPKWRYTARAIIGGDALHPCISAASIIAKEHRDRFMVGVARDYPGFGWKPTWVMVPRSISRRCVSTARRRTIGPVLPRSHKCSWSEARERVMSRGFTADDVSASDRPHLPCYRCECRNQVRSQQDIGRARRSCDPCVPRCRQGRGGDEPHSRRCAGGRAVIPAARSCRSRPGPRCGEGGACGAADRRAGQQCGGDDPT